MKFPWNLYRYALLDTWNENISSKQSDRDFYSKTFMKKNMRFHENKNKKIKNVERWLD